MKFKIFGILLIIGCLSNIGYSAPFLSAPVGNGLRALNAAPGKPGQPGPSTVRELLDRGFGFYPQLGKFAVDKKIQLARGSYVFTRDGGASVVLPSLVLANLADVDGTDLQIPKNALIKSVILDVLQTPSASSVTGFSSPTMGLMLNSENDLLNSTSVASLTGKVAGNPVGTAATLVKSSANSVVALTMRGGSVVSGAFNVFIEYYLSN